MKHTCQVALIVSLTFGTVAFAEQPDAKALILKSIENYDRDWRGAMHWGYLQKDVTHNGDTTTVEISEVIPLAGTPYERLTGKDGKPLSEEEKRKEDEKYQKALRERQNETPAQRQARIRKYENERSFLKDLPNAYDYTMIGEDVVDGRPAWVVGLKPRPDFVPTTSHGSMLKHIEGKLWIDKAEVHWAKAEAHVIDTISIGWIVARIGPGAKISLDMARVTEGLWMPKRIDINGTAKVLMVHNKALNEELTFSGFRKGEPVQQAATNSEPSHTVSLGQSFRPTGNSSSSR